MTSAAPPLRATAAHAPAAAAWRRVSLLGALSAGVVALLWLTQALATPPHAVRVVRAEMTKVTASSASSADAGRAAVTWQALDLQTLATWRGPYLLRFRMRFTARDTAVPYGIAVSLRGAFTATWDGVSLGANGAPGGSAATETPGAVDWLAPVPTGAAGIGEHELLLRASSQHLHTTFGAAEAGVRVAPLAALAVHAHRAWLLPMAAVGALLAAAGYVLLVIAHAGAAREAGDLLGMALSGTLLAAAEAWRPLVGYAYPLHATRLRLILLCTAFTMVWLARYVRRRVAVDQDRSPDRWRDGLVWLLPVSFALVVLTTRSYDLMTWMMHLIGVGTAVLLLLTARNDARELRPLLVLLLTALVAMIVRPQQWLDGSYLMVLAVIMITVLLGHASHLRDRALHAQVLESTRLRLTAALVRRSIHPHWLMNTLTGLQELIEQRPSRASHLVELLAHEFRLLADASRSAWIRGEQELALCRTHLDIVSQALPSPRTLQVHGELLLHEVALPPGVLHALVENALTHGGVVAPEGGPDLLLRCRVERECLTIDFDAPRGRRARATNDVAIGTGTGTQFVETSLEAAFPGAWEFTQRPVSERWCATLQLPMAAARASRSVLEGPS